MDPGEPVELVFEQVVDVPRDRVFAFFADPSNLAVLYSGSPGFRLLRHGGNVLPGSETWVSMTVLPLVPVVMGFRHETWEPPTRFGEVSVRGPFARFVHFHEFEERPGGTLVRDRLDIRMPWWAGGEAGARWLVAPFVGRNFRRRHASLLRLVAEGALAAPPALDGTGKGR